MLAIDCRKKVKLIAPRNKLYIATNDETLKFVEQIFTKKETTDSIEYNLKQISRKLDKVCYDIVKSKPNSLLTIRKIVRKQRNRGSKQIKNNCLKAEKKENSSTQDLTQLTKKGNGFFIEEFQQKSLERIILKRVRKKICSFSICFKNAKILEREKSLYQHIFIDYFTNLSFTAIGDKNIRVFPRKFDLRYLLINPLDNIRHFIVRYEKTNNSKIALKTIFGYISRILKENNYPVLSKLYDPDYIIRFTRKVNSNFNSMKLFDKSVTEKCNELCLKSQHGKYLNDSELKLRRIPRTTFFETSAEINQIHYYIKTDVTKKIISLNQLKIYMDTFDDYFHDNMEEELNKYFENNNYQYRNIFQLNSEFIDQCITNNKIFFSVQDIINKVTEKTVTFLEIIIQEKFAKYDIENAEVFIKYYPRLTKDYQKLSKTKLKKFLNKHKKIKL